jgi:hypothetical protein
LLATGHAITVYTRTAGRAEPLVRAGARLARTPREAALGADAIVSMAADDEASRAFWLGSDGALAADPAAGAFAVEKLITRQPPTHLPALAVAGVVGIVGNVIAAKIRSNAGHRLNSPALIADGAHARSDALVSAGVVLSAAMVWAGLPIADPIIGLAITAMILHITWESWHTVRSGTVHEHEH